MCLAECQADDTCVDEDSYCSTLVKHECYYHWRHCCATCAAFYSDIKGCEFDDHARLCRPAFAETYQTYNKTELCDIEENLPICCTSCNYNNLDADDIVCQEPVIVNISASAICEENRAIAAFNTKHLPSIASREKCIRYCLDESEFTCISIDYTSNTGACVLSEESKITQPDAFSDTSSVSAFFSYCTVTPDDCQEDRALRGLNTKTVNDVEWRHTCIQLCLDETDFICLSIDYFSDGGGTCVLSEASKYTDPDALADTSSVSTFYSYCHVRGDPPEGQTEDPTETEDPTGTEDPDVETCTIDGCVDCNYVSSGSTCTTCSTSHTRMNNGATCFNGICDDGATLSVVNGKGVCSKPASVEQKQELLAEFNDLPEGVDDCVIFTLPPGIPAEVSLDVLGEEEQQQMETALTDATMDECKSNATFYCGLTADETQNNAESTCVGEDAIALATVDKGTSGMAMFATCNTSSSFCDCATSSQRRRRKRDAGSTDIVVVPAEAFTAIVTESISEIASIISEASGVVVTLDASALSTIETFIVTETPTVEEAPGGAISLYKVQYLGPWMMIICIVCVQYVACTM